MKNKTANDRILEIREAMKYNQADFASLVGLTNTQLSRIENGEGNPRLSTLKRICAATGANLVWLSEGKGDRGELKAVEIDGNGPYRDFAIQQLEDERDTWRDKYDQVWKRLEFFLDRLPLGKHKPVKGSAVHKTALTEVAA
jgi:transcriptional regulator with XRE-family HTH domain